MKEGDSGLLDVVLDPAFETNHTVFITFNEGIKEQNHLAVFRAKFDGASLSGGKVIIPQQCGKGWPAALRRPNGFFAGRDISGDRL